MSIINYICGLVFFLCVPGILFTIPTGNKYLTTALHAVVFVIVHHTLNAYLQKHFGLEEPRMKSNNDSNWNS
jgi:general stress protein CsbA